MRLLVSQILYSGMGLGQNTAGVVVADDCILATGEVSQLREQFPDAKEEHVGVIAPTPVNAHTHLDMSLYPFVALPYSRWIPEVAIAGQHRRGPAGCIHGAKQLIERGQPVGDIVWSEEGMEELLQTEGLQGTLYWEVINTFPERVDELFYDTCKKIERWRKICPKGLRIGLTPHTPFTVHHRLLQKLAQYAQAEEIPMQIHVAESAAELDLFRSGGGDIWKHRFVPFFPDSFDTVIGRKPEASLTPVNYLEDLGVLAAQPTLIHMVHTSAEDKKAVARAGCAIVSCPRSNQHLECGLLPWAEWAAAGVTLALGTDSVASGETLDIRDEITFAAQQYPDLDPRHLIRAAVKGGRRVVGGDIPLIRRGETWHESYIWNEYSI